MTLTHDDSLRQIKNLGDKKSDDKRGGSSFKGSKDKSWLRGGWKRPVGSKPEKPQTPAPGTLIVEAVIETEMRLPEGVTETMLQTDSGFIQVAEMSLAESLEEPVENVGLSWVSVSSSSRRTRLLQRSSTDKNVVKVETSYQIRGDSADKVEEIGSKMRDAETMKRFKANASEKLDAAEFDHDELKAGLEMGDRVPQVESQLISFPHLEKKIGKWRVWDVGDLRDRDEWRQWASRLHD